MWTRSRSELARAFAVALCLVAALGGGPARADDDPDTIARRERFARGLAEYEAGNLQRAIDIWRPIYAELGPQKGYRLSYNLGVAFQELGDATRAAERFESFLREVEARRERSTQQADGGTDEPALDPRVVKDEADARTRFAGLVATLGRIRVKAGAQPVEVELDGGEPRVAGFTAYVTPGAHRVTFGTPPSVSEPVVVEVGASELTEIAPPAPPAASSSAPQLPPAPTTHVIHEVQRPYSAALVYVAGGLTVAASIVTVVAYTDALSLKSQHDAAGASSATVASTLADYNSTRPLAYAALGTSIALGVTTLALAAGYLWGKSERDVVVPLPFVSLGPGGGALGLKGRF